jgi:hypothetical protein
MLTETVVGLAAIRAEQLAVVILEEHADRVARYRTL